MNIDLDTAYLDGILLEMETLEDEFPKAIARYEYPYAQGADLEDMGQKAHVIRLRAYFWDNATQATYNDHIELVNRLASTSRNELIHPKYGVMQGQIESVTVRHDDRIRVAEVDITFIEQMRGSIEPVQFEDVSSAVEGAYIDGQFEQMEQFAADARTALGVESVAILAKELDPAQAAANQFTGLSLKARLWLKDIDTLVTRSEAQLAEIANPANSTVSTIDFGLNLPGRVVGSLARTVERYSIMLTAGTTGPARFLDRFEQNLAKLKDALGYTRHVQAAGAQQAALTTAAIYQADEASRQQLRRREQSPSFDILGTLRRQEPTAPVLSVRELEQSLAIARRLLQSAYDQLRAMRSLTTQAESLLRHVNSVKLERDKIVQIQLDNPLPLHLVCHLQGLPYGYAERVRSLNPALRAPNFTSGTVQVYTRPGGQS